MLSKPTWLLGITGPCWGAIAVAMIDWEVRSVGLLTKSEKFKEFLSKCVKVRLVVYGSDWGRALGKLLKGARASAQA